MSLDAAEKLLSSKEAKEATYYFRKANHDLAFEITGAEALLYMRAGVVSPVLGNRGTCIRYFRFKMPIHDAVETVKEMLTSRSGVKAEDNKTYLQSGNTYQLHTRHCETFDPAIRNVLQVTVIDVPKESNKELR